MTLTFKMPAPITTRVETDEDRLENQRVNDEMAADAERSIQEWIEQHPGQDPFPSESPGYCEPERGYDPMDDFYRVKDNFRELESIISANNIAGCFITRQKVFWFIDAPSNDDGRDLIMTNRYFWPIFEEGSRIGRADAMALVGEAMKPKGEERSHPAIGEI